jgi:hypothetical protein
LGRAAAARLLSVASVELDDHRTTSTAVGTIAAALQIEGRSGGGTDVRLLVPS